MSIALLYVCGCILKMSSNIRYASPFLLIDNSIMRLRKRNLEYFRIFSPINYLDYECRLRIYLKNIVFEYSIRFSTFVDRSIFRDSLCEAQLSIRRRRVAWKIEFGNIDGKVLGRRGSESGIRFYRNVPSDLVMFPLLLLEEISFPRRILNEILHFVSFHFAFLLPSKPPIHPHFVTLFLFSLRFLISGMERKQLCANTIASIFSRAFLLFSIFLTL